MTNVREAEHGGPLARDDADGIEELSAALDRGGYRIERLRRAPGNAGSKKNGSSARLYL
ncbi:MAG: hypothetical protein QOG81_780 [Gaiellaceae bacterium]|nr:hypothetical protein [Gaiellaceae bacterium]